jgi:hypothetical protein
MSKSLTLNDNFNLPNVWRFLRSYPPEEIFIMVPALLKAKKYAKLVIAIPDHACTEELNASVLSDVDFKERLKNYPYFFDVWASNENISKTINTLIDNLDDSDWVMDNYRATNSLEADNMAAFNWTTETVRFYFKRQQDVNLLKVLFSKSIR